MVLAPQTCKMINQNVDWKLEHGQLKPAYLGACGACDSLTSKRVPLPSSGMQCLTLSWGQSPCEHYGRYLAAVRQLHGMTQPRSVLSYAMTPGISLIHELPNFLCCNKETKDKFLY